MPLVYEDGTGKANANSYARLSEADLYFEDRANSVWAALSDDNKEAALLAATDYIDRRWGARLRGRRQFPAQALQFPRIGTDSDGTALDGVVPVTVKRACIEYALRAAAGALAPDPVTDAAGTVASKRVKAGPIETETTYGPVARLLRNYPAADMLMRPVLRSSAGVVR